MLLWLAILHTIRPLNKQFLRESYVFTRWRYKQLEDLNTEYKQRGKHARTRILILVLPLITILKATWEQDNFWTYLTIQSFTIFLNSFSHLSGWELPLSSATHEWTERLRCSSALPTKCETTDTLTSICVWVNNGYVKVVVWPEE